MIEDLVAPLRGSDVVIAVTSSADLDDKVRESQPVFRRNPAIAYGLGNLLENAVDFAEARVEVDARWTPAQVSITVRDDGPGFHENIFDRLGDPFVTTRPGYGEDLDEAGRHEGMGLGFFIAKTLLERTGATVSLANRPTPEHGAVVHVVWPRSLIDLGRA
jgi:two-component system sensor histidine kinase RegB